MTFADTMRLATSNLRQAKLRTLLTTMGVSIGIASLTGMVSFGAGLQDQLVGQFTRSGMFDTITVTAGGGPIGGAGFPGSPGGAGGRGGRGNRGRPAGGPDVVLDDAALKKLGTIDGVKEAYPVVSVRMDATLDDFSSALTATGIPMSSRDEGPYRTMSAGAFFANEADTGCLTTLNTARRIDTKDPAKIVGKTLRLAYVASRGNTALGNTALGNTALGNTAPPAGPDAAAPGDGPAMQIQRVSIDCRVIGVVETTGGPFGGTGGDILMPLGRAASIQAENVANVQSFLRADRRGNSYSSVTVKVSRPEATQDVAERIKALGYSTLSLADALQGIRWVFIILNSILGLIGSIALIVSSLGIVNTMVMSILERTREIGIMKAVGASDGDIRRIFLVEASVIGLMGGASGLFLGWVIGRAINLGANLYIESQGGPSVTLFSLPWWLVTGALLFSIAVSVVAGSYPANRAARLEPMSALRHD